MATGRKRKQRERLSERDVSNGVCDSPNRSTKGTEVGRNDLLTRTSGNRLVC